MFAHRDTDLLPYTFFDAHKTLDDGVFTDDDNIKHGLCGERQNNSCELLLQFPRNFFSIDGHLN